ncbi:hypothetical protein [Phenylobacterium sp.]|uniref:hypothetical protein n=1 Tax=Phenylobacterium sp. TaxID=1871053 RepID=UPI0035653AE7
MKDYRLYVFDRTGHIRGVTVLNCQDDEEAMAYAAAHSEGRTMELWQRDRQVRTFAREED